MSMHELPVRLRRIVAVAVLAVAPLHAQAVPESLSILHVGDQESWLLSAQGNLRDSLTQNSSFYGGIDRLAAVMARESAAAAAAGRFVLKLNAGDAFLPGPRFSASLENLGTALGGGQDFYDAIAMRHIGFDATVFGNHEFDLGPSTAARFAEVSGTKYLSANIDYSSNAEFAALAAAGKAGASVIVETDKGHKVGIVGLTTPRLPMISSPGDVRLIDYDPAADEDANLAALVPLLQSQVDALRASGATTVILMSHLQNVDNELGRIIPRVTGVDLVVSGGGHELMANASDLLNAGDARPLPPLDRYPQVVNDAAGQAVLAVTANFGNRYVGVLNLELDESGRVVRDAAGVPMLDTGTGLRRVSGAAADADRVTPDPVLFDSVIRPVSDYIAVLNATNIGFSEVALNGARGVLGPEGAFLQGVRNAETNLGNLVADALRFVAGTDVALQNGGGIRASIDVGNVSVGETFNVLSFTNLVVAAATMTPAQLRAVLEHGLARATPTGFADGRFPQLAGLRVVFDSTLPAGSRIVHLSLEDGTVIGSASSSRTSCAPSPTRRRSPPSSRRRPGRVASADSSTRGATARRTPSTSGAASSTARSPCPSPTAWHCSRWRWPAWRWGAGVRRSGATRAVPPCGSGTVPTSHCAGSARSLASVALVHRGARHVRGRDRLRGTHRGRPVRRQSRRASGQRARRPRDPCGARAR